MYDEFVKAAKHSFVYGFGDILMKAIGFVLMPIYLHYLSTDQYGILELLDLTVYIVGLLLAWVGSAVIRFYYHYDDERRDSVVSTALLSVWAVSLPLVLILMVFASNISVLVYDTTLYGKLLKIVFVTMFITTSNSVCRVYLQTQQRSFTYSAINVTGLVLSLSLNILFIVGYGMGVEGILWAGLAANSVTAAILLSIIFRKIRFHFSTVILKDMAKYGYPLMLTWAAMFVINFSDRFFLQRLAGLSEVGIYALAYKFGMLISMVVISPFMLMWSPRRYALLGKPEADKTYTLMFTYFMFVLFFSGLGISTLVPDMIRIIADPEYQSAYKYVPLIALSYILYGIFQYVQFGVLVKKQTKFVAFATWSGMAINLTANLTLIPRYGIWGASIATLTTFAFLFVFILPFAQKRYRIHYQLGRVAKMTVVAGVLFCAAMLVQISQAVISLIVRLVIALAFPVVLYLIRFYTPEEIASLKKMFRQIRGGCIKKYQAIRARII